MYQHRVEPMPGHEPKFIGDKSGKYQIRQFEIEGSVKDERYSRIIADNLDYDEAVERAQKLDEELNKKEE